ncbi:MAG: hypothetical protein Q8Q01_02425 [archaeon]|nr:hypothetical protein [archaeon]
MKYLFTNVIGRFIIDDNGSITKDSAPQKTQLKELPTEKINLALEAFKDKKYFASFSEKNKEITKKAIKDSVNEDNLITQTISNITELDRAGNLLVKRLREWYGLYFPELSERIQSHESFVEVILAKSKTELTKEFSVENLMGADLSKADVDEMLLLATQVKALYEVRKQHEIYLEGIMKNYCPNILELAGVTVGAKLLELGKSLKHLAMLPASTIQLLGAEKALFRHLKTGSRSPKYGVVFQHQLIQNAPKKIRGKAARMLADKLSLCARLDYFKGEFKAPEYRKILEEKIK